MAEIQEKSEEIIMPEDNLFFVPDTVVDRWNYSEQRLGTVTATYDDCPDYTWQITPSDSELISLSDIRLELDLHLTRQDGSPVGPEDCVSSINNTLHSLFQCVTVEVGGRSVSDNSNLYFLRAYLENLIGYSADAQRSQLTSCGWALDTTYSAVAGTWHPSAGGGAGRASFTSQGAKDRYEHLQVCSPLQLSGKIHSDIFQQEKPLLTAVPVMIKLTRARAALTFNAVDAAHIPKVAIRNPRLLIRRYEMTPEYSTCLAKTLVTQNAMYQIDRVAMRQLTLNQNVQFAVWNNVTQGQVPKIMLFGMVSSNALAGTHDTTPFNFQHYDLMAIHAELNGRIYPSNSYDLNFSTNCSLQAYDDLLDTLGRLYLPTGELPFHRFSYNRGFTLFGFDFTGSHSGLSAVSLIKQGNINLHLRFRTPLPETVVTFAYLVYDNVIEINNNRDVIFSFAP